MSATPNCFALTREHDVAQYNKFTAAELIKLAMINIFHKFKINNLNTKMILQVHDELLFESHIEEVEIAEKIIVNEMESAMTLSVPLKVSCKSGNNWYEAH